MGNGRPRAYTNAIVSVGNASRAVVRFTCMSCTHELEIANNNPRKHGSFFAQQARQRGWDTDGETIKQVFCPDCRKTPAYRPRRQVELDGVVMPAMAMTEPITIEGHAEPVALLPPPKEKTMARELDHGQRLQIRSLLDKYFDDKEGCYLAGDNGEAMSDQAVGSMAGVPWGEVTKIREAAYGRILVDPAMAALRTQMADLEKRFAEMRVALDGYGRKLAKVS
jgi:hypothetical protein